MKEIETSPLVSTEWLKLNLGNPEIRIIDVRWRSRFENGRCLGLEIARI